ncbi:heavy-metal-associated domain-containing protein [Mangrovimonas aestuarii]|uniref:heavy-metal-associated domain-containing protein n=1 Tax=Mangrovimonas aestuarii TaxID=3018443 RepID=UPI0023781B9C|nr:heavy metal-associated domain-containing protein [Mangrovimonas aestuarii]
MKKIKTLFALLAIIAISISCKNNNQPEIKTVEVETTSKAVSENTLDPNATYAKAEFTIDGMTCAVGCAMSIEKKLSKMDGVKSAKVDFDKKLAMVEFDEAKVNPTSLTETVKKVGDLYVVKDIKTVDSFSVEKICKPGCTKPCCADKAENTSVENENAKTMACEADCKKACCTNKAKA